MREGAGSSPCRPRLPSRPSSSAAWRRWSARRTASPSRRSSSSTSATGSPTAGRARRWSCSPAPPTRWRAWGGSPPARGRRPRRSGRAHSLKYGLTVNHVLAARVVLDGGEVVDLGGPALDPPGYDLLAVLVGSGGT